MPISYEVDSPRRIVRLRYEEEADLAALVSALSAIFEDPAYRRGFGFLLDRRAVPASSSGYLMAALSWIKQHQDEVAGSRWAVLVGDPANYGMARLGQALGEGLPVQFEVFKDPREAEAWLLATSS